MSADNSRQICAARLRCVVVVRHVVIMDACNVLDSLRHPALVDSMTHWHCFTGAFDPSGFRSAFVYGRRQKLGCRKTPP